MQLRDDICCQAFTMVPPIQNNSFVLWISFGSPNLSRVLLTRINPKIGKMVRVMIVKVSWAEAWLTIFFIVKVILQMESYVGSLDDI